MKKTVKKLQLHRETLFEMAKGGKTAAVAGTHYRSLCADLCKETDTPTVLVED